MGTARSPGHGSPTQLRSMRGRPHRQLFHPGDALQCEVLFLAGRSTLSDGPATDAVRNAAMIAERMSEMVEKTRSASAVRGVSAGTTRSLSASRGVSMPRGKKIVNWVPAVGEIDAVEPYERLGRAGSRSSSRQAAAAPSWILTLRLWKVDEQVQIDRPLKRLLFAPSLVEPSSASAAGRPGAEDSSSMSPGRLVQSGVASNVDIDGFCRAVVFLDPQEFFKTAKRPYTSFFHSYVERHFINHQTLGASSSTLKQIEQEAVKVTANNGKPVMLSRKQKIAFRKAAASKLATKRPTSAMLMRRNRTPLLNTSVSAALIGASAVNTLKSPTYSSALSGAQSSFHHFAHPDPSLESSFQRSLFVTAVPAAAAASSSSSSSSTTKANTTATAADPDPRHASDPMDWERTRGISAYLDLIHRQMDKEIHVRSRFVRHTVQNDVIAVFAPLVSRQVIEESARVVAVEDCCTLLLQTRFADEPVRCRLFGCDGPRLDAKEPAAKAHRQMTETYLLDKTVVFRIRLLCPKFIAVDVNLGFDQAALELIERGVLWYDASMIKEYMEAPPHRLPKGKINAVDQGRVGQLLTREQVAKESRAGCWAPLVPLISNSRERTIVGIMSANAAAAAARDGGSSISPPTDRSASGSGSSTSGNPSRKWSMIARTTVSPNQRAATATAAAATTTSASMLSSPPPSAAVSPPSFAFPSVGAADATAASVDSPGSTNSSTPRIPPLGQYGTSFSKPKKPWATPWVQNQPETNLREWIVGQLRTRSELFPEVDTTDMERQSTQSMIYRRPTSMSFVRHVS